MIFLYCIQETDKPKKIRKIFNIVELEQNRVILPITKSEIENGKLSQKKAQILAKNIVNKLKNAIGNNVILSKEIKKQKNLVNYLYSQNMNIIDGKWLFGILSDEAITYVVNKKKMKKEKLNVSILVNDVEDYVLENIKLIVGKYKRVNIVTNHLEKFKKLEKEIFEKDGIMVTVTNNKKKGLTKSNVILNYDFPTELINKYKIYDEAIILNVKQNVSISSKRFNRYECE